MNKDYRELIDLLEKQQSLYTSLLGLTEQVGAMLDSEADMENISLKFAAREKAFDDIKSIDARIADIVQRAGNEKLLQQFEPRTMVDNLKTIVKRLIDDDERLSQKIKSWQSANQKEFSSLTNSKKGIGGYASSGKQVYAKFIDIKR